MLAKKMQTSQAMEKACYIYSMWNGYLDRDSQFNEFKDKYSLQFHQIHTSGHAYLSTAQEIVGALKPKAIVPIHTLSGDEFKDHFENVVRLEDGEEFTIH